MNSAVTPLTVLTALLFLTSCSLDRNWRYDQSLGLGPTERLLWVPYDPSKPSIPATEFPLYYFTKKQFDGRKPTILFCAGGPGQIVRSNVPYLESLSEDYNVVYFHFRGSGFSQFPLSNSYDIYLRTRYAVEDIERIRKELGVGRWEAIVGYSYGTVVAQQYAATYGRKGTKNVDGSDKVGRIVLLGPVSRGNIGKAVDARILADKIMEKHIEVFKMIYGRRSDRTEGGTDGDIPRHMQLDTIASEVAKVFRDVEQKFGDVPFLIDEFVRLKTGFRGDLLKAYNLNYSRAFFSALRNLRMIGWLDDPNLALEQNRPVMLIGRELACRTEPQRSWKADLEIEPGSRQHVSYCDSLNAHRELALAGPSSGQSFDLPYDAEKWTRFLRESQLNALNSIYTNELAELNQFQGRIAEEVEKILYRVTDKFGGLPSVIQKYNQLRAVPTGGPGGSPRKSKLATAALEQYPLELFKALHRLFYITAVSSLTKSKLLEEKKAIGIIIAKRLEDNIPGLKEHLKNWAPVRYDEAVTLINRMEMSESFPKWAEDKNETALRKLNDIYKNNFKELSGYENVILREIERILHRIKVEFKGCLLCAMKMKEEFSAERVKHGLDYFKESLFVDLHALLDVSDLEQQQTSKIAKEKFVGATIGRTIACGLAEKLENSPEFIMSFPVLKNTDKSYCNAVSNIDVERDSSQRIFNVVSAYDGIDLGFLDKWLDSNQVDIRKALRENAGEVHKMFCHRLWSWNRCREEINEEVERVGVVPNDLPKAWNPGEFIHWVPTLVLEGTADPVTAGGQAEQFFRAALRGHRIHIKLPGIGHSMKLPQVSLDQPIETRGPCFGEAELIADKNKFIYHHRTARECLIASFMQEGDLEQSLILKGLDKEFQKITNGKKIEILQFEEETQEKMSDKKT